MQIKIVKIIRIGDMEIELTSERQRRVADALVETQRQIDREMKYNQDVRNHSEIARWAAHIVTLENML